MLGRKGFTLIELIMIIVILGILAAIVVPRYFDLQNEAREAAEKAVVAAVKAGIHTFFVQNKIYPYPLDNAFWGACNVTNPCFTTVLSQGGVTSGWIKISTSNYSGPTGVNYTYNLGSGDFSKE